MSRWNDGSVTDVAARQRFHREATPVWLVAACTLLGARAPALDKPFRYADIGCGAGFHATVVAATCPLAEVWGFDFNPANIEIGRDLAKRAGLTNIRFVEASLADMTTLQLPEFDFMIAEAVLSVVSPENQDRIFALIGRSLRPGGLAYLGYASNTGWARFAPLQAVMRILFEAGTETSDFAVERTFRYLDRLKAGGALYIQRSPVLEQRIAKARLRPAADLALELLGREWHPMMFSDVADSMAEVKCDFLGRATLHENIAAAAVPPGMLPLLEQASSIRIRETMQDLAAATDYRRDIYRRGLSFMPIAEHRDRLGALSVTAADLDAPLAAGRNAADLASLTEALRKGTLTVGEACTHGALASEPIEAAANAVALLIAAGRAHPVMPPLVSRDAAASVARLNDAIIDAITRGEVLGYLVSPVSGAAIETTPLEALTIGALLYGRDPGDLDGLTDSVRQAMRAGGRSLTRDGEAIENEADAHAMLRGIIADIVARRMPLFRQLGLPGA